MLGWLGAHWSQIVVAVLAVMEIISMFVPGASGTLQGLISVLAGLPGVTDPKIGSGSGSGS